MACKDTDCCKDTVKTLTFQLDAARHNFLRARDDRDLAILALHALELENDELRRELAELRAKSPAVVTLQVA